MRQPHLQSLARAWAMAVLGLLAACTSDDGEPDDVDFDFGDVSVDVDRGDVAVDPPPVDACAAVDRVTAVRLRSAPGGRQLHVLLADEAGTALDASYVYCLSLEDERLGPLPTVHTIAPSGPGATLLVARWSPDEVETSRALIDALVASRPADERVAVWAWSDTLVQVIGPTTDRARIANRLDAVWTADAAQALGAGVVADEAAEAWEKIAEDALLGPRSIVFIAPELTLAALPDADRDYQTDFWITRGDAGPRHASLDGLSPADAAAQIVGALDAAQSTGLGVLAFCDDGGDLELRIAQGERVVRSFGAGDAAAEHIGATCDLQAVLDAAPSERPVVRVTFTDDELDHFEDLSDDRDKETPFTGVASLAANERTTPFEASFRGQSSLRCERKSWSIDLDGGDARHLLPASGTDEFYFISMCLDDRYVNQLNGDRLMRRVGAWHAEFGTFELRVNDASHGVYLAVEKLDDELRNDLPRLRSVIRRRTDSDDNVAPAEVEWSHDDDDAVLDRYEAFMASLRDVSGQALLDTLNASMDLDQYLRWIALMTLLENGDYIDEVFFIAEESVGADHAVRDFYTIHGWDPDDIYSECHHRGQYAIDDPHGILYCAESRLDHILFADDLIYARFVDVLEQVMADISADVFRETVEATRDELIAWFEDAEVRGAMVELLDENPDAEERDEAVREVTEATQRLIDRHAETRDKLIAAIRAYREAQP